MMREHSYMEMSLRGSELVRVSPTEIGATCACLLAREHRNKNLADASLSLTRYAAAAVYCSSVGVRQCGCGGGCIQQDGRNASGSVKLDRRIARS